MYTYPFVQLQISHYNALPGLFVVVLVHALFFYFCVKFYCTNLMKRVKIKEQKMNYVRFEANKSS